MKKNDDKWVSFIGLNGWIWKMIDKTYAFWWIERMMDDVHPLWM
jgi:hypothetical protein